MADSKDIEKNLRRRWEENPKGTTFAPLAEFYRKDGQHDRALEVLRIGLESNPNHIPGNIVLGRCCLDLKQDPEAEAAFSKALELDPENVIALKALADICERSGRLDVSEQWLTQLVQVDPSNDDARDQLSRVHRAREVVAQTSAETLEIPPLAAAEAPAPAATEETPSAPIAAEAPALPALEPAPSPAAMFFEEPVVAEPAPPLPDLESVEFDRSAAATIAPEPIPGMMIEDPEAAATPPLSDYQAIGGDFSGAGIDRLDVGVEKAEEIVLRVNTNSSEFQTPSASDDLAASFGFSPPEAPPATPVQPEPPMPVAEETVFNVAEPEPAAAAPAEVPTSAAEHPAEEAPIEAMAIPELVVAAEPVVPQEPPAVVAPLPIIYPPAESHAAEVDEIGSGGEPEPILTETMAELYLRQGHRHEALRVYRQLAERTPGDVHLRERVAELTVSVAEGSAARRAAVAFGAAATGGQSVEALFRDLLGSLLPEGATAGTLEAPAGGQSEQGGGAPTRPAQDSLSLSAIFGEDASPIRPTVTPAAPAGEAAGSEAGKAGVSFDQFFGDRAGAPGAGPGRPRRNSRGSGEEDLDQFQNWLKGLKR
ncbi:MAG: tetratricopeptide repeat protein [Gemmatimonadales bacterium]